MRYRSGPLPSPGGLLAVPHGLTAVQFLETKIPAPVVAGLAGAAMKAHAVADGILIDPTALRMQAGLGLSQLSAVLAVAAAVTMWQARTTINPLNPSMASRIVTHGVYRFSRNPMYLSLLMLLAAYAIRLDSLAVWLGPLLFTAYVTRFQIMPEERILAAKFGDTYLAYQRRTRRWV